MQSLNKVAVLLYSSSSPFGERLEFVSELWRTYKFKREVEYRKIAQQVCDDRSLLYLYCTMLNAVIFSIEIFNQSYLKHI